MADPTQLISEAKLYMPYTKWAQEVSQGLASIDDDTSMALHPSVIDPSTKRKMTFAEVYNLESQLADNSKAPSKGTKNANALSRGVEEEEEEEEEEVEPTYRNVLSR